MTSDLNERPKLEVADVIRAHGDEFRAKFAAILSDTQRKALRDLARCRTAELGGHVDRCLDCGHERFAYNSCRNRHCPKCQAQSRAAWLAGQAEHLLPVEYFHLVFTLPDELSDLAKANPCTCYDLLFQAASATIREVAANPKRLGAMPGLLLVLHPGAPGGSDVAAPSARAWRGDGWSRRVGIVRRIGKTRCEPEVGEVPEGILLAGAGFESSVSRQVSRWPEAGTQEVALLRQARFAGDCGGVPRVLESPLQEGLGGVCQEAVWRPGVPARRD